MKTDLELQKDVQDELKWEPKLYGTEIGVTAKSGIITLTGIVDSYSKKVAAEKATERIAGVKIVAQEIEVRLSTAGKRTDTEIAKAILDAFKWNESIPDDRIKVKVENSWVYLEGEVEWQFQKDIIKNAVEFLQGVKGVSNYISIKPKLNSKIIKENTRKALYRNAAIEAENIVLETIENKVILKGRVHSWYEKNEIEKAAWSAPGVVNVEDDLIVA